MTSWIFPPTSGSFGPVYFNDVLNLNWQSSGGTATIYMTCSGGGATTHDTIPTVASGYNFQYSTAYDAHNDFSSSADISCYMTVGGSNSATWKYINRSGSSAKQWTINDVSAPVNSQPQVNSPVANVPTAANTPVLAPTAQQPAQQATSAAGSANNNNDNNNNNNSNGNGNNSSQAAAQTTNSPSTTTLAPPSVTGPSDSSILLPATQILTVSGTVLTSIYIPTPSSTLNSINNVNSNSNSNSNSSSSSLELSTAAKIGIGLGVGLGFILIIVLIFILFSLLRMRRQQKRNSTSSINLFQNRAIGNNLYSQENRLWNYSTSPPYTSQSSTGPSFRSDVSGTIEELSPGSPIHEAPTMDKDLERGLAPSEIDSKFVEVFELESQNIGDPESTSTSNSQNKHGTPNDEKGEKIDFRNSRENGPNNTYSRPLSSIVEVYMGQRS